MATYRINHETRYTYATKVSTSQHVAYLCPRDLPSQTVHRHELTIDPQPAQAVRRTDYFGNETDYFTILTPHLTLSASSQSIVEVNAPEDAIDAGLSPPWEEVRAALAYRKNAPPVVEASEFAYASPYVSLAPEIATFARPAFADGRPLLAAAVDLMHQIHDEFEFNPSATTVTTPVTRVLADRHGVCQDFAHLQISCLRSLGLAARYVSGYLLTDPPPGQPRLIGADASHAWLSVYCPRFGWVDLDPTNDTRPTDRHVTLAWGRDYGDVSPLRGVILGGAAHTLDVGVSVVPVEQ
jgi:transglutaminase-like putative cysteine protease